MEIVHILVVIIGSNIVWMTTTKRRAPPLERDLQVRCLQVRLGPIRWFAVEAASLSNQS
jgi:hypothetical protein